MPASSIPDRVWGGSLPLSVSLSPLDCRSYDQSLPYLIHVPRLSYLPFLLARLRSFFSPALVDPSVSAHAGWFSFEGVPLKWQYPIGLLYDLLFSPSADAVDSPDRGPPSAARLPWRLVLNYHDWPADQLIPLDPAGKTPADLFINAVKEADYLRNGTAKAIMSLSRADCTALWESVQSHDSAAFDLVNRRLLKPIDGNAFRHLPVKFYLPKPVQASAGSQAQAVWRVVQGLVAPSQAAGGPQTLGTALHLLMPSLFPSRRSHIYARPVLHGAVVPLSAPLSDLLRNASYCDGFLHIVIRLVHGSEG